VVTFVLDTSALLRYIDDEVGADRITEILVDRASGKAKIIMSAVNWGEITTALLRRHGPSGVDAAQIGLVDLQIDIISATASRAEHSARIKFNYKIPYADAFCVELAFGSPDHVLVTADFDMKPAANDISIEFLPPKPKA
jgi:PIN domain nuclease of toxin-antitoxin system